MTGRAHVEASLCRIEELVQGLERVKDPAARAAARQLFEAILDLHGLALARITARLAAEPIGQALYQEIGDDEQVKAVLLLYGLHPDSAEDRIRAIIPALERQWDVSIHLSIVADGVARVTLDPGPMEFDRACREVGAALIDAAPDLDDIAIDRAAATVQDDVRAAVAG